MNQIDGRAFKRRWDCPTDRPVPISGDTVALDGQLILVMKTAVFYNREKPAPSRIKIEGYPIPQPEPELFAYSDGFPPI